VKGQSLRGPTLWTVVNAGALVAGTLLFLGYSAGVTVLVIPGTLLWGLVMVVHGAEGTRTGPRAPGWQPWWPGPFGGLLPGEWPRATYFFEVVVGVLCSTVALIAVFQ
jgi:hypothetical protein